MELIQGAKRVVVVARTTATAKLNILSRCSAVGSAHALGACRQFLSFHFPKARNPLKTLTFSGVSLFKNLATKWFDHRFDHLRKNLIQYRGVAKLVSHRIWDAGIARSSRVTPTKFGFGKQFPKPFSLFPPTQILRGDRSRSPRRHYTFFACFFISAISAFIVFISSASFSSHSSRVFAYTFLEMRLPLTLGVKRPS